MTTTIINKDTYFRQNIYVSTINIGSKPFLNIPNMRVNGDVSMNSITIGALTTNTLNVQNNTTLNFNYNIVNNSTKSATSIGYTNILRSATAIGPAPLVNGAATAITKTNIPAGVYIFDYSYNVISTGVSFTIHQLYEYINNTTTNTNIITLNNTFHFTSNPTYTGTKYNTTFGVLTATSNTITFSVGNLTTTGSSSNLSLNNFYLRYTRIA
jgi:hypothetical protein